MNAPDKLPVAGIADVQGFADSRNIAIDDVGIRGLRYPLQVAGRDGKVQATVAEILQRELRISLEQAISTLTKSTGTIG